MLCAYPWPGNVRELGAVIDRAAILGDGKTLEIAKALGIGPVLPVGRSGYGNGSANGLTSVDRSSNDGLAASANGRAFPTLDTAMARHIEAALKQTAGQIEGETGAAALLGINPHTLRARMRKLGIPWQQFRLHR
jgi:DNA-binding NtrC family response regulator